MVRPLANLEKIRISIGAEETVLNSSLDLEVPRSWFLVWLLFTSITGGLVLELAKKVELLDVHDRTQVVPAVVDMLFGNLILL